ncbi:hypothetical protein IX317_000717 [Fusobacterium sp. DD29]|uniref:RadC family protein n=1 Tax=unclassified Fusobacterium TaxID=2648384 RepID=UPI001B8B528A|nr:hypothetical protein [Fusobacterium sp. DD45]MBR8711037.1 hypothetical protein [Fusobacterium sp. DD28]MBR8749056.1 hypothetical protein [Fusobacterium sp. DD29]MBR8751611.1 hypothetical protein [Fusobacterium sp. DD26]MBR8761322.1 hypothetical protein [Fusobacterium sp. DD25]MBR8767325.1 hypothetical protein [Fusobacterium sp. DD43]MBR8771375.1 hypothetical protein [Fusobacterium sp. DD40]MBR8775611.1 hypothetical protein [Fusobacterium sp. DD17]MBR8797863.1 hypothetical protein [Fusoba
MANSELVKGHRKRLKERYKKGGYETFEEYEFLELLLTYAIPRKDVKDVAKKLLTDYKNITNIINSDIKSLTKVEGVGESTALFLRLLGDVVKNTTSNEVMDKDLSTFIGEIRTKNSLLNYLHAKIGHLLDEEFDVLYLNNANKLLATEKLFCGTIDKSVVYPRKIIERVLFYNAKGVIFAHNHPSGNIEPSRADVELTQHMRDALDMIDVKLLDHVIIGKNRYFSFLEEGLM